MTCPACACSECVETHGPLIEKGVATPTPEELIATLKARGWEEVKTSEQWTRMELRHLCGILMATVLVPRNAASPDYRSEVRLVLARATEAGESSRALLDEVLARRAKAAPEKIEPAALDEKLQLMARWYGDVVAACGFDEDGFWGTINPAEIVAGCANLVSATQDLALSLTAHPGVRFRFGSSTPVVKGRGELAVEVERLKAEVERLTKERDQARLGREARLLAVEAHEEIARRVDARIAELHARAEAAEKERDELKAQAAELRAQAEVARFEQNTLRDELGATREALDKARADFWGATKERVELEAALLCDAQAAPASESRLVAILERLEKERNEARAELEAHLKSELEKTQAVLGDTQAILGELGADLIHVRQERDELQKEKAGAAGPRGPWFEIQHLERDLDECRRRTAEHLANFNRLRDERDEEQRLNGDASRAHATEIESIDDALEGIPDMDGPFTRAERITHLRNRIEGLEVAYNDRMEQVVALQDASLTKLERWLREQGNVELELRPRDDGHWLIRFAVFRDAEQGGSFGMTIDFAGPKGGPITLADALEKVKDRWEGGAGVRARWRD